MNRCKEEGVQNEGDEGVQEREMKVYRRREMKVYRRREMKVCRGVREEGFIVRRRRREGLI